MLCWLIQSTLGRCTENHIKNEINKIILNDLWPASAYKAHRMHCSPSDLSLFELSLHSFSPSQQVLLRLRKFLPDATNVRDGHRPTSRQFRQFASTQTLDLKQLLQVQTTELFLESKTWTNRERGQTNAAFWVPNEAQNKAPKAPD